MLLLPPLECEISCFKGDISDFSYTNKQNQIRNYW